MSKVKAVKIHNSYKTYDDNEALWEVDATLTFADGTSRRYEFDWVRAGHMHALKHPRSADAQEMFEDLLERDSSRVA